jgi:LysM repeat protein
MTAAARARGLLATLTIVAILVGLPWVLVRLGGWTLPRSLDLAEVWRVLTSPDDGTVAVAVIKGVAWVVWALLAFTLLVEILAQARHIDPPRLRGFAVPQGAARGLVATAALLFIAGGQVGNVLAAHAAPPAGATAPADPVPSASAVRTPSATVGAAFATDARRYTVKAGDTLWHIAATQLGSGQRYGDIVTLNTDLLGGKPDFLRPGWVLTLPTDAATVTVQKGDTLSSIARAHFDGDESAYRQIFDASRDLTQPDGRHLTDPDLIYPGWHLHLTSTPSASPAASTPAGTAAGVVATATPQTVDESPKAAQTPSPATRRAPGAGSEAAPEPVTAAGQPTASVPSVPATSVPTAGESPASGAQPTATAPEPGLVAPWLLIGLTGGGALLAGSMLRLLRQRRATQLRSRRPGRAMPAPPAAIIPVEKTLIQVGTAAIPTVETLDRVLRSLAQGEADAARPVPGLAGVEVSPGRLMVHLAAPADLPSPWDGDPSGLHWHLTASALDAVADRPTEVAGSAPYPQLVTVGTTGEGITWLLNAEEFGSLTLTGDPTFALDFARYLIAEFAVNAWSSDVRVDCLGLCHELVALNPERIRFHTNSDVLGDVLDGVRHTADRLDEHGEPSVVEARVHGAGDDLWGSRVVFTHLANDPQLRRLHDLVDADPRRAATSIFVLHTEPDAAPIGETHGVEIQLTADGRALLPAFGLELVAVGLTAAEAAGCAALIEACDNLHDEPIPATPDTNDEVPAVGNEAGQLLADVTLPRLPDGDADPDAPSVLPDPDDTYLAVSATTAEDLNTLAPRVPAEVRTLVEKAEPTLDADVDAWFAADCDLPRLTLLGPVEVRLGVGGNPVATARRKAYYAELAAFLAVHPNGVTADQIANAVGIPVDRVRKDTSVLREWLGKNPRTGEPHLPESTRSRATRERGINAYQLEDVLVDADLFKRLRTRGETRGADGIADLRTALRLVTGRPFDQLRAKGGTWLTADARFDHYLACGIVDVAHLVAIDALHHQDYLTARAAAEVATMAAPYDEIPQLDLAAIAAGEGRFHEADRILRTEICNRTDDGTAPDDLSERTAAIVGGRTWVKPDKAAS